MKLEDLIALSRPEALAMLRQIRQDMEDEYDIGLADGAALNNWWGKTETLTTFEKSAGCVFHDLDACGTDCCKVMTER